MRECLPLINLWQWILKRLIAGICNTEILSFCILLYLFGHLITIRWVHIHQYVIICPIHIGPIWMGQPHLWKFSPKTFPNKTKDSKRQTLEYLERCFNHAQVLLDFWNCPRIARPPIELVAFLALHAASPFWEIP